MPKVVDDLPRDLINLRALEALVGSRKHLAEKLDISPDAVASWFYKRRHIPSRYISDLVAIGGGRFSAGDFIRD